MSLNTLWDSAKDKIKETIGNTSYETWFSTINIKEKNPETILIETPDDFFKNWIVEHYKTPIEDILRSFSAKNIQLEFSVNAEILKEDTQNRLAFVEKKAAPLEKKGERQNLNSKFTFENFVIGSSNRFACAACLAVAESPARAYNPLFIYGPVGLGKTHLIQSITHKIRQLHPNLKHHYMSSEQFTNELIDAIRNRSTDQFRKRYREIDVLLIDDVHFIAGKESTQEEFFHTFNYLHSGHKQIIITSDRPPKEIANLEERLSSRFAWGLITDIQPPDFETRVAILRKKMEMDNIKVPDNVIFFIAEQIQTNIRELEGALICVVAYALLEEKPLSLEMAKIILKDLVKEALRNINVDSIQKTVSEYFRIPLSEIRAQKRTKNIVLARQIAMYLSRQLANMSLPEIGQAFGGKDHTTVLHSCRKIEEEMLINSELKNTINHLSSTLKQ